MEYRQLTEWNHNNTPYYLHFDSEMLLVGLIHSAEPSKNSQKADKFSRKMQGLNGIILEASSEGHLMRNSVDLDSYEYLAVKDRVFGIHYLEPDLDRVELFQSFGMTPQQILLYATCKILPEHAKLVTDFSIELAHKYLVSLIKEQYTAFRDFSESQILSSLLAIIPFGTISDEHLESIDKMAKFFNFYTACVRETEVMAPRLIELRKQISGPVACVTGVGHTDYLAARLAGETPYELISWPDFVKTLDPKYQTKMQELEQALERVEA